MNRRSAWASVWPTWRRCWARARPLSARELTKLHEEVRRGALAELASGYADEDAAKRRSDDRRRSAARRQRRICARIDSLLRQALAFMPVRAAADLVAEALDTPRRGVYARALELKADQDG